MSSITIESASIESLTVTVTSDGGPDNGEPIEFLLTPKADTSPSGTWFPGTYQSVTGDVGIATTPLIGAGELLNIVEGNDYRLWVRWRAGLETPVMMATVVRVT